MRDIPIDQQIAELKAELRSTRLTRKERQEALTELEWFQEQARVQDEMACFTLIEHEATHTQPSRFDLDRLPFRENDEDGPPGLPGGLLRGSDHRR